MRRRMMPSLLIGALLLLGGGWWIGVATSLTAHRSVVQSASRTLTHGLATATPRPTATHAPARTPTPSAASAFAARIIARTNMYRVKNGCPALTPNTILMGTALQHSADMAMHDFVGHDSSTGVSIENRIKAAGYNYSLVAENIAWGQQTPEQVVDMWFNESPPNDLHRKNILNCALRDIGAGYVYLASDPGKITAHTYWTEDFGTRVGS